MPEILSNASYDEKRRAKRVYQDAKEILEDEPEGEIAAERYKQLRGEVSLEKMKRHESGLSDERMEGVSSLFAEKTPGPEGSRRKTAVKKAAIGPIREHKNRVRLKEHFKSQDITAGDEHDDGLTLKGDSKGNKYKISSTEVGEVFIDGNYRRDSGKAKSKGLVDRIWEGLGSIRNYAESIGTAVGSKLGSLKETVSEGLTRASSFAHYVKDNAVREVKRGVDKAEDKIGEAVYKNVVEPVMKRFVNDTNYVEPERKGLTGLVYGKLTDKIHNKIQHGIQKKGDSLGRKVEPQAEEISELYIEPLPSKQIVWDTKDPVKRQEIFKEKHAAFDAISKDKNLGIEEKQRIGNEIWKGFGVVHKGKKHYEQKFGNTYGWQEARRYKKDY